MAESPIQRAYIWAIAELRPGRQNHRLCLALGLVRRSWEEKVLRSLVDGDGGQSDGGVMGCVLVKAMASDCGSDSSSWAEAIESAYVAVSA